MNATNDPIDYLSPDVPAELPWHDVPLVVADDETVAAYGWLVDDPDDCEIEIVQWPAQGWRSIDAGTGDEGGTVEGVFTSAWRGQAVENLAPERVLLWHMNYHPDGGQMFYPLDGKPFVVPVALPGDDLRPGDVVALHCDGSQGLYIHPGIWHDGVFPVAGAQSFRDRQGRVHARVSCNFAREFGVFLNVPLGTLTSRTG